MTLSFYGRRMQVYPFSSNAERTATRDLNQLWHEVAGPSEEAFASARAEIACHAARLRRAIQLQCLAEGKRAHSYIIVAGLDHNVLLGNLLVQMYGFGGALQDARAFFKRMQHRNASSWSLLIKSYARMPF
ncbi:hypothetical protein GOP47_0013152 [Adiantum capillus-veneris]|uniref:Pentatricopeptide repeat-containing protein n=1 Tax=Adiantum capillus-veneris TaxID=13818 RepID=A0A9D4ZFI5_ADICA|nr:hypothetical protein GOP47_0013152 [Adiantum capillus-veneris]